MGTSAAQRLLYFNIFVCCGGEIWRVLVGWSTKTNRLTKGFYVDTQGDKA